MFALETLTDSTVVTNLLDSLSGLSTLLIVGLLLGALFVVFFIMAMHRRRRRLVSCCWTACPTAGTCGWGR